METGETSLLTTRGRHFQTTRNSFYVFTHQVLDERKSAVSERNGEVAGNSSSDSLLSSRKDHLSRHPLPNSKDGANLLKNTEIAKINNENIDSRL